MNLAFVSPEPADLSPKERHPASYLRKRFEVAGPVRKAVAYMTALGVYEPHLNGARLGGEQLLPGFTDYRRRVQYQEFDLTELLAPGSNTVGCVLGDGWYRGNLGSFNKHDFYGSRLAFACRIEITYTDGTEQLVETDSSWLATLDGPLRENDLKTLEVYDARREDLSDAAWHACEPMAYAGMLVPALGEPVLEHERFSPAVLHTPDGSTVLDFGQNLAGHVEFTVTGAAGTQVALVMGETLDLEGNFTLENVQGVQKREDAAMAVRQRLAYTLKDGRQTYKSTFLISGYRYVKLEGWPEAVRPDHFQSIAIYSDLAPAGEFSCSNELVNRLVENVRWSMKSNFVDIPTDCPTRERAGWTGDINVFNETADYLADTRRFISKWLADVIGMQDPDGAVPIIVPEVPMFGTGRTSSGWSDVIATVPWTQYWFYGETADIEAAYDAVKRYVEYCRALASKRHPLHLLKCDAHQEYIVDTGYHFGEWLEPGGSNLKDGIKAALAPDAEVATAWFYRSASLLSRMAGVLGRDDDREAYAELAERVRAAYRHEFVPGGTIDSERQCKYVRPLYMGLLDEGERAAAAARLNELVVANEYKVGTGFLTTYQVLQVLTDNGYAETAYGMLDNEACPGWLYEVKRGATTVWEGWDAVTDDKINLLSQNHYAPGAAASWLFSRCAGIRPAAPGFSEVEIRPVPGGSLTWAHASYESVQGRIGSSWRIADGVFTLEVELPEGLPARVVLPDGTVHEHAASGTYTCALG